jgi:hypothetical protein
MPLVRNPPWQIQQDNRRGWPVVDSHRIARMMVACG